MFKLPDDKTMKANYTGFMLALLLCTGIMFALGFLITTFVQSPLDSDLIMRTFNLELKYFQPEKAEKLCYYTLTFLFPFIYITLRQYLPPMDLSGKPLRYVFVLEGLLIAFGLTSFLLFTNWAIYCTNGLLGFSGILLLAAFILFIFHKHTVNSNKLFWAIAAVLIAITAFIAYTPSYAVNDFAQAHFMAYYTPIYKTYSGLTPGVDFMGLYGFYPYLYTLFLKLTGGISMARISIINTVLISACLFFAAAAIFWSVKNKVLGIIGLAAYSVFFYIYPLSQDYYLQFLPHRVIFIIFIIALSALYLNLQNNKYKVICRIVGYIAAIKALVWNFESGFITLAVWAVLPFLLKLPQLKTDFRVLIIAALKGLGGIIISLLCAFFIIQFITYLRAGTFLSLGTMFSAQALFYRHGYFMLPMTLFGAPWLVPIFIYAISHIKAFALLPFYKGRDGSISDNKAAMYFILAFSGLAIFIYYQGRSHISLLGAVSFPAMLILTLMAQEYSDKYFAAQKNKSNFTGIFEYRRLIIVAALALTAAAALINGPKFMAHNIKQKQQALLAPVNRDYKFIEQELKYGVKPDIIALNAAVFYTLASIKDTMPLPAVIDWSLKTDYDNIFAYLTQSAAPLITDAHTLALLAKYDSRLPILLGLYKPIKTNGSLTLYNKK